ncbi:MAG TPA: diguanylate cyclase [Phycisphaerae bacterium]|nr:diguanylate cyclase [Phycisphaerae bacterium]
MVKSKVLIVDDDPAMLRLLEKFLADAAYEVLKAADGQEALRVVLGEAPPIVITDWTMPGMDGVQLSRALREHEGVRFVYIILLTAHSEHGRLVEAFEAGVDDFLTKPVRSPELLARVRAGEHIARLEEDLAKRTREIHRLNAEMAITNEKLALANDKLKRMATTDELTGLLNRREAMHRLQELWSCQDRFGQPFSCIMLDVDHFKRFNDMHGHAVGDMVLRETGIILRESSRTTDIVCRVGGEEFLVLCPNVGAPGAEVCAEHLRAAVETHDFRHEGKTLRVTISLGVAERQQHMVRIDDLLKAADAALYAAKDAGRNRVVAADAIGISAAS